MLPKHVYAKWYEKEDKKPTDDGEARFEKLMKFPLNERQFTETALQLRQGDRDEKPKDDEEKKRKKLSGGTRNANPRKFNNRCLIHPNSDSHFTRKC